MARCAPTPRPACTSRSCGTGATDHQPFPRAGRLGRQLDSSLEAVRTRAGQVNVPIYYYVVVTIEGCTGRFVQRGSGPNWQGDRLTLCTCKHFLRTFRDPADWPGVWLAGFSGVAAGGGANALVYLARVGHAFATYADLWDSPVLPAATKEAKAAHRHPFGDLFTPLARRGDPTNPRSYRLPCRGHVHRTNDGWHGDIAYEGRGGRPAALLVADPLQTFLWEHPMYFLPGSIGQGQRKGSLGALLAGLTAHPAEG